MTGRYWYTRTRETSSKKEPRGARSWQVRDSWTDKPVSYHPTRNEARRQVVALNRVSDVLGEELVEVVR